MEDGEKKAEKGKEGENRARELRQKKYYNC